MFLENICSKQSFAHCKSIISYKFDIMKSVSQSQLYQWIDLKNQINLMITNDYVIKRYE